MGIVLVEIMTVIMKKNKGLKKEAMSIFFNYWKDKV